MAEHVLETEFVDDRLQITGRDCLCKHNGRGRITKYAAKCPWHSYPDRLQGRKPKHRGEAPYPIGVPDE